MLARLCLPCLLCAAAGTAGAAPVTSTVTPFRTETTPRIDPVFGGVTALRKSVDQFLALQAEMEQTRDEFSSAVHKTLAEVTVSAPPGSKAPPTTTKVCPPRALDHYERALAAGARYLALGRRLETRFREIKRADELGDAAGLTPDYRSKTKHAAELHGLLLRDYREMRIAFYDQLGAEMRNAGCALRALALNRRETPGAGRTEAPDDSLPVLDPSNLAAWDLEPPPPKDEPAADPRVKIDAAPAAARAIWIDIDNSHCPQPSRLAIDGAAIGQVAAQKKLSVRTHAGPHELCVLPLSDKRSCGDAGTVRRAYVYDGWTLTVRCEKQPTPE